jgi:hypothetical protein
MIKFEELLNGLLHEEFVRKFQHTDTNNMEVIFCSDVTHLIR